MIQKKEEDCGCGNKTPQDKAQNAQAIHNAQKTAVPSTDYITEMQRLADAARNKQ